jgi:hypothetical protein
VGSSDQSRAGEPVELELRPRARALERRTEIHHVVMAVGCGTQEQQQLDRSDGHDRAVKESLRAR